MNWRREKIRIKCGNTEGDHADSVDLEFYADVLESVFAVHAAYSPGMFAAVSHVPTGRVLCHARTLDNARNMAEFFLGYIEDWERALSSDYEVARQGFSTRFLADLRSMRKNEKKVLNFGDAERVEKLSTD